MAYLTFCILFRLWPFHHKSLHTGSRQSKSSIANSCIETLDDSQKKILNVVKTGPSGPSTKTGSERQTIIDQGSTKKKAFSLIIEEDGSGEERENGRIDHIDHHDVDGNNLVPNGRLVTVHYNRERTDNQLSNKSLNQSSNLVKNRHDDNRHYSNQSDINVIVHSTELAAVAAAMTAEAMAFALDAEKTTERGEEKKGGEEVEMRFMEGNREGEALKETNRGVMKQRWI